MITLENPKTKEVFTANESYARRAKERGFAVVTPEKAEPKAEKKPKESKPEEKGGKAKDGGAE